ncbi:MAG: hypothetical protein JST11_24980, partial [Acidobacteria bacterium]|nr:hypothetical protein [Acidobacteriota bacterium]
DTLDYVAFSPDRLWPWEVLIAFIPNVQSSWLGRDEETARAELAERLASAPI